MSSYMMILTLIKKYLKCIIKNNMFDRIKQNFKAFILRSDLFSASTSLRYKGVSSYETIGGGVFSIILVVFFIAIFATKFIDLMNKVEVEADVETEIDTQNQRAIKNFTFAIGVQYQDFRDQERIVDITIESWEGNQNQDIVKEIQMAPCQREKWMEFGEDIGQRFDDYGIGSMLCPVNPNDIQLSGIYGVSQSYKDMIIRVHGCIWEKDQSQYCSFSSEQEARKFLQNLEKAKQIEYINAYLFVLDTTFAPTQDTYKIKKINYQSFIPFSSDMGTKGRMYIGEYNITTDQSILPWESEVEEKGYFIEDFQANSVNIENNEVVTIIISKSDEIKVISRKYQKIDDMLSDVGGLFVLLFKLFMFFLGSFTVYKYELAVAQSAFSLDESGKKYKQKDFHFFKYLKYVCYDWLTFFGCNLKWEEMELIHKVRGQATEQMDIRLVIKKFQRLQNIIQLLLKQRNLICAQLTEPQTLNKIQRLRKVTQYCDRVLIHKYKDRKVTQNPQQNRNSEMKLKIRDQLEQGGLEDDEAEIPSDFDEQDIEVEKLIIKSYQELMNDDDINPVEDDVMKKIPKKMKKRLDKLSNKQYYDKALERGPYRQQSIIAKAKELKEKKRKRKRKQKK